MRADDIVDEGIVDEGIVADKNMFSESTKKLREATASVLRSMSLSEKDQETTDLEGFFDTEHNSYDTQLKVNKGSSLVCSLVRIKFTGEVARWLWRGEKKYKDSSFDESSSLHRLRK